MRAQTHTHTHTHTLAHKRVHTHSQVRTHSLTSAHTHTHTQIEGGQEDFPLTHFVPCHNITIFLQNSFIYNIKYSI